MTPLLIIAGVIVVGVGIAVFFLDDGGESEVIVKRKLLNSFFIHQWLSVKLDGKSVTIDPYYGVFKVN